MADSAVVITSGAGTNIDTRTESTNSQHRQVVVLGDPALNNNVAAVATQDVPGTDQTTPAIMVRVAGSITVQQVNASMNVYIGSTGGTIVFKLDPDHNITQKARSSSGTFNRAMILTAARQIIGTTALRKSIVFVHDSPNTIYIGLSSSLTSAVLGNGFPLVANQIFGFDDYTGPVFGTTEAGEAIVKYIEM